MAASIWKYAYLAWFSQPREERELYRCVRRRRATRLVEVGIGPLERAERMIAVAGRYGGDRPVRYTGVDLFDARPAGLPPLPLKEAHRRLQGTSARVRLLPGDPATALASAANSLGKTDLLLLAADLDAASLARAWFYVPRMLHAESLVLRQEIDGAGAHRWAPLTAERIESLAASGAPRRAA